jgi:phosphonate transport system substrate-binding protein
MKEMKEMKIYIMSIMKVLIFAFTTVYASMGLANEKGTSDNPLNVMLVPTDGGTADGTIADFLPIFNAINRSTGLEFKIWVGQSYSSVVEGLDNKLVDIAFVGPTLYLQAAERGAAEPLSVAVQDGESVYYAGIFSKSGVTLSKLEDLKGRSMAFGDVNSSSSFTIQVGMMIEVGLDPARDLSKIYLTGGHANSLNALSEGHVDFAAASFNSYIKAVNAGAIDPAKVVPVMKSAPIPYPPFIMHPSLSEIVKARLRNGFDTVHEDPNVSPEMIRGFGGILVDKYTSDISHSTFETVQKLKSFVTKQVKSEMLKAATD